MKSNGLVTDTRIGRRGSIRITARNIGLILSKIRFNVTEEGSFAKRIEFLIEPESVVCV